jgi:hypothetical protein
MLVVGRVDVDEVDVELRGERVRVEPRHRAGGTGDRNRETKRELVVGAGGPGLQIGHLQTGRAVDTVCRLEERRQQHAPLDRGELVPVDRLAHRVDPRPVLRLEVPRPAAEGLGEVALAPRERLERGGEPGEPGAVERPVRDDVGLGHHLGIGGEVVRMNPEPQGAQCLPDPGRAGEEVARRAHGQPRGEALDQRHESSLRPDVLDHGRSVTGAEDGASTLSCRGNGLLR